MTPISHIRNFCIIAHIDHGKSTLADRMLQITHTVADRDFRDQVLDSMDLERERGITIKSHPVTMKYKSKDGDAYLLNLIDTPGHVDFSYEVSRTMAACEGAILVVDAAQGVEAQTVANTYLAIDNDLEIIPVLNKVDLASADTEEAKRQIEEILGMDASACIEISAKTGKGVEELLEEITRRVPPAKEDTTDPLRALVFDSLYDTYRGITAYVRIFDGDVKPGDKIRMISTECKSDVKEVGVFTPDPVRTEKLGAGEVGYVVATMKDPADMKIGDTITNDANPSDNPLPGFKVVHPMVFSGVYPVSAEDYEKLKHSMDKLSLNDSAFSYQAESSVALGFGFRCGFLGLLHMEIVQERLRREFDLNVINTYPSVIYRVHRSDGDVVEIDNPVHLPDPTYIETIEEPMIRASIICYNEHIGDIMRLVMDRRGQVEKTSSLDSKRVILACGMPLNEILVDFHDALKSVTRGYGSMDYEHTQYQASDLAKLDVLLNGDVVDAFSCIIHKSKAQAKGRQMCKALKEIVPPHLFVIPIQAAIGKTIIARETIRALRKDVTAKCYGGDVSRKRKLLERQKEGKKRMKQVGKVSIPQKAFMSVLKNGM